MRKFERVNFLEGRKMITFSALLAQLVDESGMTNRKVALEIQEKLRKENSNVSLSYPAFFAYRNFTMVPTFEKALIIVNFFNYDISNEDLSAILEYSRSELKKMREDEAKDIRQGIRIKPSNFYEGLSASELEIIINQRIDELYGEGNGSMNAYVNDLIKNDLIKYGYIKEK